jgi:hypothetical protein
MRRSISACVHALSSLAARSAVIPASPVAALL